MPLPWENLPQFGRNKCILFYSVSILLKYPAKSAIKIPSKIQEFCLCWTEHKKEKKKNKKNKPIVHSQLKHKVAAFALRSWDHHIRLTANGALSHPGWWCLCRFQCSVFPWAAAVASLGQKRSALHWVGVFFFFYFSLFFLLLFLFLFLLFVSFCYPPPFIFKCYLFYFF